jgi:CelD/BcsL family acetyltransferase involved in cellulose biosynthesis
MSQSPPDSQRIARVGQVDREEWQALAERDPAACSFQNPRFIELFAESRESSEAAFLELRDDDGSLQGGLPFLIQRRGPFQAISSGPAGAYGGPLATSVEGRNALIASYLSFGGPRTVRREMLCRGEIEVSAAALEPSVAGYLSLEGGFESFLREQFPRNRRNECNRSERRGIVFEQATDAASLGRFHEILAEYFVRWKTRPLELPFLSSLLEELPAFTLFIVKHEGEIIGGHLCCEQGDELFPWVGATERRDGIFPAPYLIREEARYAAERGLRILNLGASDGLAGVADFKRLLGASERTQWHLFRESAALGAWRKLGMSRP